LAAFRPLSATRATAWKSGDEAAVEKARNGSRLANVANHRRLEDAAAPAPLETLSEDEESWHQPAMTPRPKSLMLPHVERTTSSDG
jgi:hypothetical protein